jgi:hypothetical protein
MGGYPQAAQYAGLYAKPGVYGGIYPQYGTLAEFSRPAGVAYQPVSYPRKTTSTEGLKPMVSSMGGYPQASEYKDIYYDPDTGAKVTVIQKSEKPKAAYEGHASHPGRVTTRPTTPPAPPWLPEFVPSQRTGQPITKAPITTPSGQQWMAAPPTVQQGLAGYGTWAGYNLPDILAQMYRMQPQTPLGAGRQGWAPAYQWA